MDGRKPAWLRLRESAEPPRFNEFGVSPEAIQAFSLAMGRYLIGGAHGFWMEPESGDGHCDPDALVVELGRQMDALSSAFNGHRFGSVLEERMFAALLWLEVEWAGFPMLDQLDAFDDRPNLGKDDGVMFFITPQAKIGPYKVDFALWFVCGKSKGGFVVECDGHAFHEKTKEQAARDKKRDREILSAGYPVMRFTGSEIYRDVVGCVEQLEDVAIRTLNRVSREGGLF